MNFTKPAIEKLECLSDSKPSFYWDSSTSGFGVKVTPNNKKTYIFQGRVGSTTRRITIGNIKDWRLTEAREKAKELAIQHRKLMIEELNAEGAGYSEHHGK